MLATIIWTAFVSFLLAAWKSEAIDVFSNERLALVSRRAPAIILVVLACVMIPLQIAVDRIPHTFSLFVVKVITLAMPALALCIFVGINKRFWGYAYLLPAGALLNAIAIIANNWRMPVDPVAGYSIGMYNFEDALHSMMTPATRLPFLCDRFAYRWIINGVFSIGDLLISIGVAIATIQLYNVLSPSADRRP